MESVTMFDGTDVLAPMTESEARACADSIKAGMFNVGRQLLDLYERDGWRALGYVNWRECAQVEFGYKQSHVYRLLEAAAVERNISPMGENASIPERHLRPLTQLEPEEQSIVWEAAVATSPNGKVTAAHVQSVVDEYRPPVAKAVAWSPPVRSEPVIETSNHAVPLKPHVSFNSGNNEWYTPPEYIEAARLVMGGIDLDPASSDDANEVVSASTFYTADDDGLAHPWIGRVWMNPGVCTCGIYPNVIDWSHENENMHQMLESLSGHAPILSGEDDKREVVFQLVQRMPSGICEIASGGAQSRSDRTREGSGGKAALRAERKRTRGKAGADESGQSKEATTSNGEVVLLDTGAVGTVSAGVELPLRVLWSGRTFSSRSLHSVITSGLSRDSAGEHSRCVLEVQFVEGQSTSGRLDAGQASICPHCGAVGFSVVKPLTIFCNPPYATGLIDRFAAKIVQEYTAGHVTAAIVLVNNATETQWFKRLADIASAVVFPRGRVRFWQPSGETGAPLQGQAILYIGDQHERFVAEFSQFGWGAYLCR